MNLLIIISLALIIYWKARNNYYKRLTLKYSYMIYDMRDTLREMATENKIKANDWRFMYLDTTFSKAIHELSYLNFLLSIFLSKKYKHNNNFISNRKFIVESMNDNPVYATMFNEFTRIVSNYVIARLFLLRGIIKLIISLHGMSSNFKNKWTGKTKKYASIIPIAPETSTVYSYIPVAG